jgi:hypothetical protein
MRASRQSTGTVFAGGGRLGHQLDQLVEELRTVRKAVAAASAGVKLILNKRDVCEVLNMNEHELDKHLNDMEKDGADRCKINGIRTGRIWKVHREEVERFARAYFPAFQLQGAGGEDLERRPTNRCGARPREGQRC